jgi:pilus assembly protein CpaF
MATIHANSAQEAIRKLQTLPLLAGENITQDFITPTVARAIDIVVHVGMDRDGERRILQLVAVGDRTEGSHIDSDEIYFWTGNSYQSGIGKLIAKSNE